MDRSIGTQILRKLGLLIARLNKSETLVVCFAQVFDIICCFECAIRNAIIEGTLLFNRCNIKCNFNSMENFSNLYQICIPDWHGKIFSISNKSES